MQVFASLLHKWPTTSQVYKGISTDIKHLGWNISTERASGSSAPIPIGPLSANSNIIKGQSWTEFFFFLVFQNTLSAFRNINWRRLRQGFFYLRLIAVIVTEPIGRVVSPLRLICAARQTHKETHYGVRIDHTNAYFCMHSGHVRNYCSRSTWGQTVLLLIDQSQSRKKKKHSERNLPSFFGEVTLLCRFGENSEYIPGHGGLNGAAEQLDGD